MTSNTKAAFVVFTPLVRLVVGLSMLLIFCHSCGEAEREGKAQVKIDHVVTPDNKFILTITVNKNAVSEVSLYCRGQYNSSAEAVKAAIKALETVDTRTETTPPAAATAATAAAPYIPTHSGITDPNGIVFIRNGDLYHSTDPQPTLILPEKENK